MATAAYARFLAPTVTVKRGNVDCKPDADLPKTGQPDGVGDKEQNPDYKASAGWFQVISWDFKVGANVNVSAGVSVGNVTKTECTLLVYHGENTSVAYRAAFNRSPFDLELHITERGGQTENKMNSKFIFKGAVFLEVATATGDPRNSDQPLNASGTTSTSIESSRTDTKELDTYRFVYQKVDMNTFGKETHCSMHGTTT